MSTAHNNRARTTNDARYLRGHSGTSPAGRRRRDLVQSFVDAMGSYTGFWVTRLIRRRGEPAFQ